MDICSGKRHRTRAVALAIGLLVEVGAEVSHSHVCEVVGLQIVVSVRVADMFHMWDELLWRAYGRGDDLVYCEATRGHDVAERHDDQLHCSCLG